MGSTWPSVAADQQPTFSIDKARPPSEIGLLAAAGLQDVFAAGLKWADLDPAPRMIVDMALNIVWQNRPASEFIADHADLVQRSSVLAAVSAEHDEQLRRVIRRATRDLGHALLPTSDDSHIIVRFRRLNEDDAPPLVGLILYDCADRGDPEFADLRVAFALTNAERDVILKLHLGMTAEKIAAACGISIETVRSHIRSAYLKLGVSSREEMFRKLHPYRLR